MYYNWRQVNGVPAIGYKKEGDLESTFVGDFSDTNFDAGYAICNSTDSETDEDADGLSPDERRPRKQKRVLQGIHNELEGLALERPNGKALRGSVGSVIAAWIESHPKSGLVIDKNTYSSWRRTNRVPGVNSNKRNANATTAISEMADAGVYENMGELPPEKRQRLDQGAIQDIRHDLVLLAQGQPDGKLPCDSLGREMKVWNESPSGLEIIHSKHMS